MRERDEENTSERLRLRTVVEYNGERKRLFLIPPPTFADESRELHPGLAGRYNKRTRSVEKQSHANTCIGI